MWIYDIELGDGASLSPTGHIVRFLLQIGGIIISLWIADFRYSFTDSHELVMWREYVNLAAYDLQDVFGFQHSTPQLEKLVESLSTRYSVTLIPKPPFFESLIIILSIFL